MDDIHVSAPGKVILTGEHAVVYGKVAIAASLNLRTYLHLKKQNNNTVQVSFPNVNIETSWSVEEIKKDLCLPLCDPKKPAEASEEVLGKLRQLAGISSEEADTKKLAVVTFLYLYCAISGESLPSILVSVNSDLPVSAGLGSSASFSVCLAASLLELCGLVTKATGERAWSEQELTLINSWAYLGEKILHGNPSGIDNSISTFGGAVRFQSGKINPLKRVPKLKILLVNTGVPRSTKVLVAGVREKYNKYPDIVGPILDSIQAIAVTCVQILDSLSQAPEEDLYRSLEDLIDINQNHLASLGVSHPALHDIVTIATRYNLHAKLTGAGGGGCAFILLRPDVPDTTVAAIKSEFESKKFTCWETSVGSPGVVAHGSGDKTDSLR